MLNKFGIGDRVRLVIEVAEEPRHLAVYHEREVTGVSKKCGDAVCYTLLDFPGEVEQAELYATDADLMDRVRRFAEAGRGNGNGGNHDNHS